jgi:hypothetical protein
VCNQGYSDDRGIDEADSEDRWRAEVRRPPADDHRFAKLRAALTTIALAVGVITI